MKIRVWQTITIVAVIVWLATGVWQYGGGLNGLLQHSEAQQATQLDQYGGYLPLAIANNDGYFRTKQVNDDWWLVTPDGHGFYSLGVDTISATQALSISSGYAETVQRNYADSTAWGAATAARLEDWHFNTIGAWSSPQVEHRGLAHTRTLHLVGGMPARANWVFPDVFDPRWEQHLQTRVDALISDADVGDKWLLGWYLGNELWWYQDGMFVDKPNNTVVENYIALPITSTGKLAWVKFLEDKYQNVGKLNAAWATGFSGWRGDAPDTLLQTTQITATNALPDKSAFLGLVADRFFSSSVAAVRQRDPHHLILGVRYLPDPALEPVLRAEAKYVDVVTANLYNKDFSTPDLSAIDDMAAWSGKPIIITEFTARAEDAGMPNGFAAPGRTVPSQEARADAYRLFLELLRQRPYVVGAHWFSYADDPALGSRFAQSNNWGLVDSRDQPYTAFVERIATYNQNAYAARLGQPDLARSIPAPLSPSFDAASFGAATQFAWTEVAGADSYTLQLARRPDFSDARSYVTRSPTYTLTPAASGRWYWRVRVNNGQPDAQAYTSAWPLYVYQVAATRPLTAADWPIAGVRNATTVNGANVSYSGQPDPGNVYATVAGPLVGDAANWQSWDFLRLSVTAKQPAHMVIATVQEDKSFAWFPRLQAGDNVIIEPLLDATHSDEPQRRLELAKLSSLVLGLHTPAVGQQITLTNTSLVRVVRDKVVMPPITATVGANVGGIVELDWSSYRPATTTIAYRIFAADRPIALADTATITPSLTIDAAAQHSRARVYRTTDGTLKPMLAGQQYWFVVVPLDVWDFRF